MSEENGKKDVDLGMFNRPRRNAILPGDFVAAGLSVFWVLVCALFFLFARRPESTVTFDTLNFVVTLLAVLLPIALIWVAAVAARSVSVVREESMRLQAAVDTLRQNYVEMAQTNRMRVTPAVSKAVSKPAAPASSTQGTARSSETPSGDTQTAGADPVFASQRGAPVAQFSSHRHAPATGTTAPAGQVAPPASPSGSGSNPSEQPEARQQGLDLGLPRPEDLPTLTADDFIRALNFPKTAEDRVGFRALRLALKDPQVSRLIQASQDVLTLLSQNGVYMDDLMPDRARPDVWRQFADGQRGGAISTLGGVHDRASLSAVAKRMREDHIFRDATHHFLRQFDKIFTQFAQEATDAEIVAVSDTRSARAFMLLGRVTGTFDDL